MNKLQIVLFYILSFTWGAIMSVIGGIVGLILTIAGHKPQRLGHIIYWQVGEGWGGSELGCFFVCSKDSGNHTKWHEAGHGIQNIWFGPLMPFIVCLPSAARYWIREVKNIDLYLGLLFAITTIVFGILITITAVFNIVWLLVICIILTAYCYVVIGWLHFIERNNIGKPYDSVWFEGQATELGTKIFNN